jgi:hypothetical protein
VRACAYARARGKEAPTTPTHPPTTHLASGYCGKYGIKGMPGMPMFIIGTIIGIPPNLQLVSRKPILQFWVGWGAESRFPANKKNTHTHTKKKHHS